MHQRSLELGLESPFNEEWFERPSQDDRITTSVDIEGFAEVRLDALLAHETQIDPDVAVLVRPAADAAATIHPYDDYILARQPGRHADARGRPVRRRAEVNAYGRAVLRRGGEPGPVSAAPPRELRERSRTVVRYASWALTAATPAGEVTLGHATGGPRATALHAGPRSSTWQVVRAGSRSGRHAREPPA